MRLQLDHHWLEAEQIGKVTVVTFRDRELLEEATIQTIGEQLADMVERLDHPQVVINLDAVEKLSTMMLGKIIALHKRIRAVGGRLALCGVESRLYDIFQILKLPQLVPVYAEEQEALQTF
jgi:anti-sigma B factor antagonist